MRLVDAAGLAAASGRATLRADYLFCRIEARDMMGGAIFRWRDCRRHVSGPRRALTSGHAASRGSQNAAYLIHR